MADGDRLAAAATSLRECSRVLVFDSAWRVLLATGCEPTQVELQQLAASMGDRDTAIRQGLPLDGRRYEVHRHHPPLVYGRNMADVEPESSTGIAVCRVERGVGGLPCYAVVTFEMPNTTARMVPLLTDFARQHLEVQH